VRDGDDRLENVAFAPSDGNERKSTDNPDQRCIRTRTYAHPYEPSGSKGRIRKQKFALLRWKILSCRHTGSAGCSYLIASAVPSTSRSTIDLMNLIHELRQNGGPAIASGGHSQTRYPSQVETTIVSPAPPALTLERTPSYQSLLVLLESMDGSKFTSVKRLFILQIFDLQAEGREKGGWNEKDFRRTAVMAAKEMVEAHPFSPSAPVKHQGNAPPTSGSVQMDSALTRIEPNAAPKTAAKNHTARTRASGRLIAVKKTCNNSQMYENMAAPSCVDCTKRTW
jgi:hypothetical protein